MLRKRPISSVHFRPTEVEEILGAVYVKAYHVATRPELCNVMKTQTVSVMCHGICLGTRM